MFQSICFGMVQLINIIKGMNNLEFMTKFKRRNRTLVTQPDQTSNKNGSEKKNLSPFSKLQRSLRHNTLDYSKILPKNMPYDKQSLYLEVLSLKMELNQIMDQNIRLKTRIVTLQRQVTLGGSQKIYSSQKQIFTRLKRDKYDTIRSNQTFLVDGLKKIIKDTKKQVELLKKENLQIKKNMKISKNNELQIQFSTLIQQNKRISIIYQDLRIRLQEIQMRNQNLEKSQTSMKNQVKNLQKENITLKSYIKAIELEQKIDVSNLNVKQRRIRQIGLQKRKQMQQGVKNMDQLRRQFLINKQSSFRISKKQQLRALKVHFNMPIRRQPITVYPLKQDNQTRSFSKEQQSLHLRNQTLEQQNKKLIKSCQSLEMTLKSMQEKLRSLQNMKIQETIPQNKQSQLPIMPAEPNIFEITQKQKAQTIQVAKIQYSSVQNQQNLQKNRKNNEDINPRAFSEPEAKITKQKHVFKSNKRVIGQICQLLTYRMMAQRYSYTELKADIEQSPSKEFSYIDLCHMFVNEPFYLTVDFCRILLCFMLEKEKPGHNDTISSMTLIAKLRKVIKDYQSISQQQEHKIIERCANIITEHSKQIRSTFNYSPTENTTIRYDILRELLIKLGLNELQVKLVVSELSICSNDLSHLNLDVLFQRFDLNQLQSDYNGNNIIEQAQNDDSFINLKHKEEGKIQEMLIKDTNNVEKKQMMHNQQSLGRQINGMKNEGTSMQT